MGDRHNDRNRRRESAKTHQRAGSEGVPSLKKIRGRDALAPRRDAVRDAVLTRDRLEALAAREADYIRLVLLFQAEPKNGKVPVDALLAHLTSPDGEKLDRRQIAVATGDQKELDGVVLADPTCPIRYVLTVEALKEGWDCPFAYVLCSLQDMKSAKDVEQLLGRVLRMPYARPRHQPELAKAYAHVVSMATAQAATALADRLVNNMGFERYEAQQAIASPQTVFPLVDDGAPRPVIEALISLPVMPTQPVPAALKDSIEIRPTSSGATVIVRGDLSAEIEDFLLAAVQPGKAQQAVQEAIERERARQDAQRAPALADRFRYEFTFQPNHYPARPPFYSGRYRFRNHYYPVIQDLREKRQDGGFTEEFLCARAIDWHPAVRHWVRNVERNKRFSFWLPTATDYFYPDFVAELNDGRVLVVEYKGVQLGDTDDTREKDQIGRQWEASSGGRCLFLMATADDNGPDVDAQIMAKVSAHTPPTILPNYR